MADNAVFTASKLPQGVKMSETDMKVSDLEIDPNIQRAWVRMDRVETIKRNFNPLALGRIHVSFRRDRSYRVLDGWHRTIAVKELTDNIGTIPAFLYEGLTVAQEADMFLLLNSGERPTAYDRYKVSLFAKDPESLAIDEILHSLGWAMSNQPGNGHVSCVRTVQQLYRRSVAFEEEPNLVHMALMLINRAWGSSDEAAQAHILMGLGRLWQEYKDRINVDRLVNILREIEGGPQGLTTAARNLANLKRRKLSMAVAEFVVDSYNVRLGPKSSLPQWSKRT